MLPVPAASACVTALAVSGQDTSRWVFEGFLPVNKKQKRERLAELQGEKRTVIFYEAPHKLRTTLDDLTAAFGEEVALLVDGVTKLTKIQFSNIEELQAENLRKMLLAMSRDVRVMIIKLCDRLHNMRTGDAWPEQKRRDKARETMEVYAPIANRLGILNVKEELEDRSLHYLDPVGYARSAGCSASAPVRSF